MNLLDEIMAKFLDDDNPNFELIRDADNFSQAVKIAGESGIVDDYEQSLVEQVVVAIRES